MLNARRRWPIAAFLGLFVALGQAGPVGAAEVKPLLRQIKAVDVEGKGNVEAARAWRKLTRSGPEGLIGILTALDDANPLAANWLRSAVETIVDRSLKQSRKLPAANLETFVLDRKHTGSARRLAYECLLKVDKTASKRLIPRMLDDPSAELRRDAVELAIKDAETLFAGKDKVTAIAAYRKALAAARDRDQVEQIAKRLKDLGITVDLTRQFGFIKHWMLIGPFDNTGGKGFAAVHAPEEKVDLSATPQGKKKKRLRWTEYTTTQPYGRVDLNTALGKHMGATAYAFAAVTSSVARPVQLRASSNNAVKLFLNGKQIYFREEYHHGVRMDQHTGSGMLKAGRNEILIKICQNEQSEVWAQTWFFQLRVCDSIGGPVPLKLVTESPSGKKRPGDKVTR